MRKNMTVNYEKLGWKYKAAGEYPKAIESFRTAMAKHQNEYAALHGIGECFLDIGDYTSALVCFTKAISMNSHRSWAYHGAGRVYYFLHQYDTALSFFDKSIMYHDTGVVAWYWKGKTLLAAGEYESAESSLQLALRHADGRDFAVSLIPGIRSDLKTASLLKRQFGPSVRDVLQSENRESSPVSPGPEEDAKQYFYCPHCGTEVGERDTFCRICGERLQ